jgi:hypothetical protein
LRGGGLCVSQHRGRYIGEGDAQRWADAINCPECHQTFTGTKIDHAHAGRELAAVQYPIRIACDDGLDEATICGIVGVTPMQKPVGPDIRPRIATFHYEDFV